jgi:hypothetical protein
LVASGSAGDAESKTGESDACDDRGNPLAEHLAASDRSILVDDG